MRAENGLARQKVLKVPQNDPEYIQKIRNGQIFFVYWSLPKEGPILSLLPVRLLFL